MNLNVFLTSGPATFLAALLAAIPPLMVSSMVGIFETPDSGGYLAYAKLLISGPLPRNDELLGAAYSPIPLYRTIGYPAVIVTMQSLSEANWTLFMFALQVASQSLLAAYAFRVGLALQLRPALAFVAALMPTVGSVAVFQSAIMTDSLFGSLFGGAMLLLLHASLASGGTRALLLAGVLLALAATIREATLYLLIGLLPLVFIATRKGRRFLGILSVFAPPLLASGLIMADHYRRSGHAVLSTSKQVVMVQALLPLVGRGVPVFDGDSLFDRAARDIIVGDDYHSIHRLNARLFELGMTAPEIAKAASARYANAWRTHPLEMLRASATRLPVKMLWITFMPVDTAADVQRQTGEARPWFGRPDTLWRRATEGSIFSFLILLGLYAGRVIGLSVTLGAIISPLLLDSQDPRRMAVLGAWLACGAFVVTYLPVHLEQRYLIPIVPALCILGMLFFQLLWQRLTPALFRQRA